MKWMKKVPGGFLLIPMFLSSLLHTFFPMLFHIGGVTEALFSGRGLSYILGVAILLSGCGLDLSLIHKVINRYGVLVIGKLLFCTLFGVLFVKLFGLDGFWGISAITFITAITSTNPTLFLALMQDFGDEIDQSAFGFVSLIATPVIPMLIYSLTRPTSINFSPIISTLIPLIIGIIVGNLDRELGKYLSNGMGLVIILLGWSLGAGVNLLEALKAGLPGLLITLLYYIFSGFPAFILEKTILKRSGISALAMSTMAGLSASVPLLMVASSPELTPYVSQTAAVITFGVILSAIISPLMVRRFSQKSS